MSGKVAVDGVLKDSPWTSADWYVGDSHNIRAYTQTIGAVTYRFPEPGTWINITTSEEENQVNNNAPISISPSENCTWQANFDPGTVHVVIEQKLSSETSIGSVGLWEGGPDFEGYTVPKSFDFPLSSNQVLRAEQDIISGEKYNRWIKGSNNLGDVKNHHVFQIDDNFPGDLTARFEPTYEGISIQVGFEGTSENYDCPIEFKDPWFIDYADPNYGDNYRNRGNSALFITRATPFVIDYSTTYENSQSYKGVFLNQNLAFDATKPIYRLQAPYIGQVTHNDIYVFKHWYSPSAGMAVFNAQGATTTTNPETPVVFKSANATVTAVYEPVNQIANYTLTLFPGDNLAFPAGAQIACAENFCIELFGGDFQITGNEDNPAVLYSNSQWQGIRLVDSYLSADIQNVILKDAMYGIQIDEAYSFADIQLSVSHAIFQNLQNGIYLYIEDGYYAPDFENVDITLSNCSFVDNNKAIAILSDNDHQGLVNDFNLQVVNNIFYNSDLEVNCFPGLHPDSRVKYNLFYNSNIDLCNNPNIYGMGNTYGDPLFVDYPNDDFRLQYTSLCIDAGDPGFPDDPDGTRADIGAYYYHQPPATPSGFAGTWYNNHPKIYWSAVSEPDLKHYEVWKKKGTDDWFLKTTTTATYYLNNSESKWTKRRPQELVYYKVRSVDDMDYTSGYTSTELFRCNGFIPLDDKEEFFPVAELDPIPTEFMLHPVFPNPFNITTTLKLDLPEETRFSLVIYDINGSEIWCLHNRRINTYPAGYHTIIWQGRDKSGSVVPTGVYFIVYNSPQHKLTQKVVLMK